MTDKVDPWREYLDKTFETLHGSLEQPLKLWDDAGDDADKMVSAAESFSGASIVAQFQATVAEIEMRYRNLIDRYATGVCKEMGLPFVPRFSDHESKWLSSVVQSELANYRRALSELSDSLTDLAEFCKENSGFSGILRSLWRGYQDPIDAVKGVFGEDSVTRENKRLNKQVAKYYNKTYELLVSLLGVIDQEVIARWNAKTEEIRTRIVQVKEEADRMKRERSRTATSVPGMPGQRSRRTYVLAVVVAVIVVGFVVLTWTMFSHSDSSRESVGAQVSAARTEMVTLSKNTTVRKGPSSAFAGLAVLEQDADAVVLDKSVPGWVKIRTTFGLEGWCESERIAK